jgi:hypothetical protein
MNRRVLFGGFMTAVCLATLWGAFSQRSQLASLRGEQQQLLAQVKARADGSASASAVETGASQGTPRPTLVVTPELLRLRSEVTRLDERRRELAGERVENERLRAQVAARGTSGPAGTGFPTGYVRRSEARMVGYNTPDDTLQSVLWAIQNRDLANLLQALTPELAQNLRARAGESRQSIEDFFFNQDAGFVGLRIVSREQNASDGSIAVEVEIAPGVPGPRMTFRQINGQWKIAGPF